jgi:broad specificity phosphatase PhoE
VKLLLIRHAQSIDDQAKISQRDNSALSPLGKQQAKKRHELIGSIPVNAVYTSPYARTQETASTLFPAETIHTLGFIYEIKRPHYLDGGLHKDAVHFWEVDHKTDKYMPNWKFDGSESLNDVMYRATQLLEFLYSSHSDDETIAIISHGGFMRHFVGHIGMKDAYTPEVFFDLFFLLQIKNGDMIEIELSKRNLVGWRFHPLP